MKLSKFLWIAVVAGTFFYSCSDDDDSGNMIVTDTDTDTDDDMAVLPFQTGLLVTNEGPFNNGFGAVSHINAGRDTVDNDIYQDVNNDNLGNIVQSIGFNGDLAYIVTNVSNRITIVNRYTFEEIARIEDGLENPRYFEVANGKGYVTNWGDAFDPTDDYVAIIDLATNVVTTTISVSEGPERILNNGSKLYIAQKGGFGSNNAITVIDPMTDAIETEITVGDVPNSMQLDTQGNLWVLSEGNPSFTGNETAGSLSIISTTANQVVTSYAFETTEHPAYLNLTEDDLFYYLGDGVYKGSVSNFVMPTEIAFMTPYLYGMQVLNTRILAAFNPGDFASNGAIEFYDITTNTFINALEVGIVPGNLYIND